MLFLDEQSVRDVERDVQRWGDLWPADGPGPQGAEGVSAALAAGIAAYDRTDVLALRITDGLAAAAGKVTYDLESARAIERLTKLWLAPVDRVAARIKAVRADGGPVRHVDEFADRVDDAQLGISVSVEYAAAANERLAREQPELFLAALRGPGHAVHG